MEHDSSMMGGKLQWVMAENVQVLDDINNYAIKIYLLFYL